MVYLTAQQQLHSSFFIANFCFVLFFSLSLFCFGLSSCSMLENCVFSIEQEQIPFKLWLLLPDKCKCRISAFRIRPFYFRLASELILVPLI